ncbi:MAG: glycosyl transferase [Oscillospiraceae bacterium]|nr:glycosyl transferase [Oscillospiraceae bacterium]
MIPKKIHYCWFGRGEKPKLAQKCIASWEKYCPDFEIIEWNEDNFDINMNGYTRMCYEQKKYAFLSDYVRLVVVAEHGGIYFDTDVELLKCPNELLKNKAFFGFENPDYVATGLGFGSTPHGTAIEAMVREYDPFLNGTHGTCGCPKLNTAALLKLGLKQDGTLQTVANAVILPIDYMNPYESTTGRLNKTSNTVSVHWYAGAWLSPWQRFRSTISKPLHRIFGTEFLQRFHK